MFSAWWGENETKSCKVLPAAVTPRPLTAQPLLWTKPKHFSCGWGSLDLEVPPHSGARAGSPASPAQPNLVFVPQRTHLLGHLGESRANPSLFHLTPLPRAEGCSLFWVCAVEAKHNGPFLAPAMSIPTPCGSRSATRFWTCLCGKLGFPRSINTAHLSFSATGMRCRSQCD